MEPTLQQKLFNKYPKLFRQKDLDMRHTCMCWGICTGNGWYKIIDKMCKKLTELECDVEFVQIKEKFGAFCVYSSHL